MNRQGHTNTKLFVGIEVEHTPAYNQKTLFVVGVQDKDLIEAAAIAHLVGDAEKILKGVPPSSVYNSQEHILRRADAIGLEGKSIQEIHDICLQIMEENEEIRAKEEAEQNERQHQDLIGGLVFKYENPSRWFDTVRGSTLFPVDPSYITQRAYVEMAAKYPGYRSHIQDISRTLSANQRSMPK